PIWEKLKYRRLIRVEGYSLTVCFLKGNTTPLQKISGDLLNPFIRAMRTAKMGFGKYVPRWIAQSHGPVDGGRIKYPVALSAGIYRGGVIRFFAPAIDSSSFCYYLQTGNIAGISMKFPPYKARNFISLFHARAFQNPMTGVAHNPIRRAIEGVH